MCRTNFFIECFGFFYVSLSFGQVHIAVPVIVALISIYLVIGPIIDDPRIEYVYAIGFIILGLPVYTVFVFYKYPLPGMGESFHAREAQLFPFMDLLPGYFLICHASY